MKKYLYILPIVFLSIACGTVPITGRKQFNLVSDAEVLSLSNQSFNDYMKTAKISSNTVQSQQVSRVGNKIVQAVIRYFKNAGLGNEPANYQWQFILVKYKTPNAFALPGGKVVVNDGILPYTQDDDGLAVVLGHEIAHAVVKHSSERLSQQMMAQYGQMAIDALMTGKSNESKKLASTIYGLGAQYGVMLPYSRTQEYEADKLGLIFMTMAGYTPEKAPEFWQRMAANSATVPEFMSTHPADGNRIKALQDAIPEARKYK